MALKELEVKYATARQRPYKLADGGGLHLFVQPNGSKLWRLKYRFEGKEKLLSFGKYPDVSLAAARAKRNDARVHLAEGVDPGAVREAKAKAAAVERSFEVVAREWHANRASGLDKAHATRVLSRMERDVFPALGGRPVKEITALQVLEMVRAIEARGALDISRRAKQCVGQVFRYAIANGWTRDDPTIHLLGALKKKPRVRHMARVPLKEMAALIRAIATYDGEDNPHSRELTKDALLFTFLTWARTNETRFATWDEFEGLESDDPLWRIPAERMKMEREHLVPLSPQAVALLQRRRLATNSEFVFPGEKPGKAISQNTMLFACYRLGYRRRQTVHGFRGLASTWANEEQAYNADWIEMALAHADEDDVRGAYNSALYLAPRRTMLENWGRMVDDAIHQPGDQACSPSQEPVPSESQTVPAAEGLPLAERPSCLGIRLIVRDGQRC